MAPGSTAEAEDEGLEAAGWPGAVMRMVCAVRPVEHRLRRPSSSSPSKSGRPKP